jgi:putative membrane protein
MNFWYGGWIMLVWAFLFIVFWAGIITLFIWLIRRLNSQSRSRNPLDIAKERYARGEISKEEYEQIKRDLIV